MKSVAKLLNDLYEEKDILEKNVNLYYFDKEKRERLFIKIDKIKKEIERVEKNGYIKDCDTNKSSNKKKSF